MIDSSITKVQISCKPLCRNKINKKKQTNKTEFANLPVYCIQIHNGQSYCLLFFA